MADLKNWWRRRRPHLLAWPVYALARLIGLSMRLRVLGEENLAAAPGGKIYCGWHGKSLIPANYFEGKGVWALFSLSNDGELQSRIFRLFGFRVIRGSTGRGGARAAIEAIRVLRSGDSMAITPDGPRGPAFVVQRGVLLMAQKSGAALIPVGSAAQPCAHARSWDKYMVPLPFAKAVLALGPPISVPEGASESDIEHFRTLLQEAISVQEAEAAKALSVASMTPGPGVLKSSGEERR